LDIHQINTGQGNATFAILPDGTTLLIDAGAISPLDWQTKSPRNLPRKPNGSRQAGEWIARYIQKCLGFQHNPVIDYAVLTHFHDDHMGSPVMAFKKSGANYALTGITEVAEYIPIRKILDRGWPDYSYPRPFVGDSMLLNYRQFLTDYSQKNGLKVERFEAGQADQIRLVKHPKTYKNSFSVQNIAVNGRVWAGKDLTTQSLFPDLSNLPAAHYPTENMCSIVLQLRYGLFDYFTGGDIPGVVQFGSPTWHDVETPVATVSGQVDVQLMNHHGHQDSQNGNLLAKLNPCVLLIPVWHSSHATTSVLERVFADSTVRRDVFATSLVAQPQSMASKLLTKMKSTAGHIVVRVNPGGASYSVFILDDQDESHRITAMYGPYQSR
jgi:beta-lactamase superfamily II metal-dependent hydrolase